MCRDVRAVRVERDGSGYIRLVVECCDGTTLTSKSRLWGPALVSAPNGRTFIAFHAVYGDEAPAEVPLELVEVDERGAQVGEEHHVCEETPK